MSLDVFLIMISVGLSLYGGVSYVVDTIKGKTKPNRLSWGLWAAAPLIGVGAAISSGADVLTTARTFMAGFIPLLVFVASFLNKNSYWKTEKFDLYCGVFSVIALILWLALDIPVYAVLLAAIGDLFAAIPTIKKAWKNPETETGVTYVMSLLSVLIILPTIKVFDIPNTAFQIYLVIVNIALIIAVYRRLLFKQRA